MERPASVVKELVENSLDAGAKNITIEISKGGITLIRVSDDGCGMSPEDARLSVRRYATSKIEKVDDLFQIKTFGFRGEALASIPEVSRFEMQTRAHAQETGVCLRKDQEAWQEKEIAMSVGTSMNVSQLFYNVPARRKFLKTAFTEYGHILTTLIDFALIQPTVSFKFIHNGTLNFFYDATNDWLTRLKQVLGKSFTVNILPVSNETSHMTLSGYVSSPAHAISDRRRQHVFVNRRGVRDHIVLKAIQDAYRGLTPRDRFPVAVLCLEVDPNYVDVNVHPRKSEVKFVDTSAVYRMVFEGVRHALGVNIISSHGSPDLVHSTRDKDSIFEQNGMIAFSKPSQLRQDEMSRSESSMVESPSSFRSEEGYQGVSATTAKVTSKQARAGIEMYRQMFAAQHVLHHRESDTQKFPWKLLGQVARKYLVAWKDMQLFIFDQHAAAEGVLFHKLKESVLTEHMKTQPLLVPYMMELAPDSFATIEQYQSLFQCLGFRMENFGKNTFIVQEVPADLSGFDIQQLILGVVADLVSDQEFHSLPTLEEKKLQLLRSTACHSAVKFEDTLQPAEQEQLLKDIVEWQVIACAHGRPIAWEIGFDELDKKFARC